MILKLLSRFMSGRITKDEYDYIKSKINTLPEKQMQSSFQTLWETESLPHAMPTQEKMDILENLNNKISKKVLRIRLVRAIAAVILPFVLIWGAHEYTLSRLLVGQDVTIMTDAGQKTHLKLSDGSVVWLNSKSSMQYSPDFGYKNRTVKLVGEAYFEVAGDKKRKFIVETEGINVVVYGTRFNISAHPQSSIIEVSLIEGSVAVEDKQHIQLALLSPNHRISINKENLDWNISSENAEDASLWHLNRCNFDRATAGEVFKKLEYWYGMKIHVEKINTNYRYSFTIKNESIRELLELINELTPLGYKIDGEEVYVRYK